LNIRHHGAHGVLHASVDDAGPGDVFAVLGGVGDGEVHSGDAAFVNQVGQ
jgi:hypothetical protein